MTLPNKGCSYKIKPLMGFFNTLNTKMGIIIYFPTFFVQKVPEKKESGVVYLGHLPHGFYEKQIKQYMTQFGKVKAVKVSRSIKVSLSD